MNFAFASGHSSQLFACHEFLPNLEIIHKANSVIERAIKEIRERSAHKEAIRTVREEVDGLNQEFLRMKTDLQGSQETTCDFDIGDVVHIKNTHSSGKIETMLDNGQYVVVIGDLRARISKNDLEISNQTKQVRHPEQHQKLESGEINREIDLRGMYADEAISAIDKFLDSAILAGLHRVDRKQRRRAARRCGVLLRIRQCGFFAHSH